MAREHIIREGPKMAASAERLIQAMQVQSNRSYRNFMRTLQIAVFNAFVLIFIGYWQIRRHIVVPLRSLETSARELRSGNLKARVLPREGDEIGALQVAFNEMAAEIESLVKSLEERRHFAESLLTHAPAGVVVHRDNEIVFANPHLFSLLGINGLEEIPEKSFMDLFHSEDREKVLNIISLPKGDIHPHSDSIRLRESDNRSHTVELIAVPIEYDGVDAILTMLRDATERQLLIARMMQIDRTVAIGTLAAGMGHEINNPLSFVIGNLEFSLRQLQKVQEKRSNECLETTFSEIEEALQDSMLGATRIRDIVARLRTFSRGDESPQKETHLQGALDSAIHMASHGLLNRAQLNLDLQPVPSVLANESKLSQVFLNLLLNAAQAIDPGDSANNSVTVRLFTEEQNVIIEISDTGEGIPETVGLRVFDPFFTTKAPGKGTGLGLPICQRIIEDHGGVLTFESQVKKGTTFRVTLPAFNDEALRD